MPSQEIILTRDGSHTLYDPSLDETYHSRHGAVQESLHVFVRNGLEHVLRHRDSSSPLKILEVGFGTGLNALLTFQFARHAKKKIAYSALEPFPIAEDLWSQLNFLSPGDVDKDIFRRLHRCPWDMITPMTPFFEFVKYKTPLLSSGLAPESVDLIYYDAFAPAKQPEMWSIDALTASLAPLVHSGTWVSYCAKGQVKRDLKTLGCRVESLSGPPGKMEMTRATKV